MDKGIMPLLHLSLGAKTPHSSPIFAILKPFLTPMATSMSSFLPCPTFFQHSSTTKPMSLQLFPCYPSSISTPSSSSSSSTSCNGFSGLKIKPRTSGNPPLMIRIRASAVAEEVSSSSTLEEEAARRLYIGNIPRNLKNDDLRRLVEEHGAVETAEVMFDKISGKSRRFGFATMKTVEDANAVIEKLNGTEIGGRKVKVNITEKPVIQGGSVSVLQTDESKFVDSGYKVYVGNLAKTVTTDLLKKFFSAKGNVVSAKVERTPGTKKSNGFGFVCFSSDEEVEAAISALNNADLEGQKIRVNKA